MKHNKPLSLRQLITVLLTYFLCTMLILLLFSYKQDEKQFARISDNLFRSQMLSSTLNMHYTLACPEDFGIEEYEAVLPCYSALSHLHNQASTENILTSLAELNPEKLDEDNAYTLKLLLRSLDNSLELNSYAYYEEPLSPSSGMQSQLPILLAEYTFRDKQDISDYLSLLEQTGDYFASLLRYEREKAAAGLIMPASSLEKVISQCDFILTEEELQQGSHFLQTTFEERLALLQENGLLTAKDASLYQAENDRLLRTVMLPAYQALADGLFLLTDETIPLTGLGAKPLGKEYYQCLLRSETGSYRSIEEIRTLLYNTLQTEYDTIRSLATQNPEVVNFISRGEPPAFPYTTAEEMLTDLQLRMQENFPALPATSPSVTVKNVSSSLEQYCAPAFYLTPPLDDTDTNVIYINQKNSPTGVDLYTTLAHEGYPGHLYQTVYNNRRLLSEEENPVRELLWYGGYLEGWALYVEFLSFDYASDVLCEAHQNTESIYIQMEKHNRSMQLCLYSLLDIMIHYDNASYSQIAEVLKQFGINDPDSADAIYTYIAEEPCNYLKYYLGYLEILALRDTARGKMGANYSDHTFHQFYLDAGPSDFLSLRELLDSHISQETSDTYFSSIMDSK